MIEVTKKAAEEFRQLVAEPSASGKKIRVTFDAGG